MSGGTKLKKPDPKPKAKPPASGGFNPADLLAGRSMLKKKDEQQELKAVKLEEETPKDLGDILGDLRNRMRGGSTDTVATFNSDWDEDS